jgi:hypothetical protein
MQALTTALPAATTTYVGPADGDFFRYFLGHSYVSEGPAAAGAGNGGTTASQPQ